MNRRFLTLASTCGLMMPAVVAMTLIAAADPAWHNDRRGHGHHWDGGHHDHEAARAAVERGEIKPLVELLGQVKDKLPGDIAGVELERHHGVWLYEFRVIDKAGRLFDVHVDAKSGEIKSTGED